MSNEVREFWHFVSNNEITVSLDWDAKLVEIRTNGSISRMWAILNPISKEQ